MLDKDVAYTLDSYKYGLSEDVEAFIEDYKHECCRFDEDIARMNDFMASLGLPPIADPWNETGEMRYVTGFEAAMIRDCVAAGIIPPLVFPTVDEVPDGAVVFSVVKPESVDDLDSDGGNETAYTNRQVADLITCGEWAFLRPDDPDAPTVQLIAVLAD